MRSKIFILFLAVFVFIYFMARLPFYTNEPSGEEGSFTHLFFNAPRGPNYLLEGRIHGVNLYGPPQHPAPIYELIKGYGSAWKFFLNNQDHSIAGLTFFIRVAFSLIQFGILLLLCLVVVFSHADISDPTRISLLLFIGILAVSTLAIETSISLHVDGSVGSFLPGIFVVTVAAYHHKIFPRRVSLIGIFLASVLYGLGKTEWNLALLGAILVTGAYNFLQFKVGKNKPDNSVPGITFTGILAGNLLSYAFDRANFVGGYYVMTGITGYTGLRLSQNLILNKLPFIYVCLFLFAFLTLLLILKFKNNKTNSVQILLFVLGSALFISYLISPWNYKDPRYYTPSFIVFIACFITVFDDIEQGLPGNVLVILSLFFLTISTFNITQKIRTNYRLLAVQHPSIPNVTGCIPISNNQGALDETRDFLSASLGPQAAEERARKYNEVVCP